MGCSGPQKLHTSLSAAIKGQRNPEQASGTGLQHFPSLAQVSEGSSCRQPEAPAPRPRSGLQRLPLYKAPACRSRDTSDTEGHGYPTS